MSATPRAYRRNSHRARARARRPRASNVATGYRHQYAPHDSNENSSQAAPLVFLGSNRPRTAVAAVDLRPHQHSPGHRNPSARTASLPRPRCTRLRVRTHARSSATLILLETLYRPREDTKSQPQEGDAQVRKSHRFERMSETQRLPGDTHSRPLKSATHRPMKSATQAPFVICLPDFKKPLA